MSIWWIMKTLKHPACTVCLIVWLLQLAFNWEGNLYFPWENFQWHNAVVNKKKKELSNFHYSLQILNSLSSNIPQQSEAADTEIKVPSVENTELRCSPFKELKPGVGKYVVIHAMPTAKGFFLANFYPSSPFMRPAWVFPVLAVANTDCCVGLLCGPVEENRSSAHHCRQLKQVPLLGAQQI